MNKNESLKNLPKWRKYLVTILLSMSVFHATALNSAWGVASEDIENDTNVSSEVSTLGISLFVIIAGISPMFTAPLSEFHGRRPVYMIGFAGYVICQAVTAFGRPIVTVLIFRSLCAVFAGVFLANVGGSIADLFESTELGLPMTIFTLGSFNGPALGPVLSGVIVQHLGWRWVFYVFLIWSGVLAVLNFAFVPETLDKSTIKNSPSDNKTLVRAILENVSTPFMLMRDEPMLDILCLYSGFLMAVVYLFLVVFPLVFKEIYGFGPQGTGLSFLALSIGITISAIGFSYYNSKIRTTKNNDTPEKKYLSSTCVGGIIAPIGLLAFAWTIYPSIHWTAPLAAAAVFGLGYYTTFNAILGYLVAAYPNTAASAVAVNVFVRGVLCGAFPLFGKQLFQSKLGFHWATTLIGLIALLLMPLGFIFKIYGERIRNSSKHNTNNEVGSDQP